MGIPFGGFGQHATDAEGEYALLVGVDRFLNGMDLFCDGHPCEYCPKKRGCKPFNRKIKNLRDEVYKMVRETHLEENRIWDKTMPLPEEGSVRREVDKMVLTPDEYKARYGVGKMEKDGESGGNT